MLNWQKVMKLNDLTGLNWSQEVLLEIEQSRKATEQIAIALDHNQTKTK